MQKLSSNPHREASPSVVVAVSFATAPSAVSRTERKVSLLFFGSFCDLVPSKLCITPGKLRFHWRIKRKGFFSVSTVFRERN